MSEKLPAEDKVVLAEADVAEVLERAIQLDGARDTRVTAEQLREAAVEVGVSPQAFSEALAQYLQERSVSEVPSTGLLTRFSAQIRTALGVVFGATLGATAGILDGPHLSDESAALAVLLLLGASLRLALSHRRGKALLPYVVDVIWLWCSFTVASALVTNALGEESIIATVLGIVVTSIIGAWIIKMTGGEPTPAPPQTIRLELARPKDGEDV